MAIWQEIKGRIVYQDAMELMHQYLDKVINGYSDDIIMLLEHGDVYTKGTNAKENELLDAQGIPVISTGRGGKFTYHGSGQRIIYPIIDLRKREKDLKLYIKQLEHWMIETLAHFGVKAYTVEGRVGIWTRDSGIEAKIGAIGIRVRKWVAYHGIAINIAPDLSKFNGIIPCGISDAPVTSLAKLEVCISMQEFDEILKAKSLW